ncbi:MAG: hypothetical protein EZS28_051932, partial [Streblomastix strix]
DVPKYDKSTQCSEAVIFDVYQEAEKSAAQDGIRAKAAAKTKAAGKDEKEGQSEGSGAESGDEASESASQAQRTDYDETASFAGFNEKPDDTASLAGETNKHSRGDRDETAS